MKTGVVELEKLSGKTYCLVSAFSSIGTSEAYFCISSFIDVCLFTVSNVDIALCVTLNQRHTELNKMDFHLITKAFIQLTKHQKRRTYQYSIPLPFIS